MKIKITLLLFLAAAFCMPLAGSMFADEWGLDNGRRDKGRIKKIVEEFKQGDVEHIFDTAGRKILRTFPEAQTSRKVEYKMTYGKNGKLSKVECFIGGKLAFTEVGNYDDDGVLRGIIRTDAEKKEEFSTTMLIYDDKTKKLKAYGVQTPQGIIDYFYEYDAVGNLIKVRAMLKKRFISAAMYFYDSRGFVREVRRMNENFQISGILKNSWKLDKHGNWIQKMSALHSNLAQRPVFVEIVTRKIEYAE